MKHVCAIIVTYEPDFGVLGRLIDAIAPQVDSLVVVDNGSQLKYQLHQKLGASINNKNNVGLASAQNQGINWAKHHKASHVLIFDQDSEPEANMVKTLCDAEVWLLDHGHKVAAVGPVSIDRASGVANPFYALKYGRYQKKYDPDFEYYVDALFLIASGQLIRIQILDVVGSMKEELFIDYVDVEWGLRASATGYKSYGVTCARMFHSVGDKSMVIGQARLPMHSPTRNYYMTRNALILYFSFKYPLGWVVADSLVMVRRMLVATMLYRPRRENLKNILTGIIHGLFGKSGPKLGG